MSFPAKASTQAGTSTRISGRSVTSLFQAFALRVPLLLMIASGAQLAIISNSGTLKAKAWNKLVTLRPEMRVEVPACVEALAGKLISPGAQKMVKAEQRP